ncbi:branched-chain amino acid ABC transporter permease [Microbacterium alcoholitolerans]|uniref:branched-chain amino acid ABC transporter permease n=1 Tax=unclassified Microbacterium TaxID=2609290 RepID=UPI003D187336
MQFIPVLEFALCYALFALSTYAALSTGILSLAAGAFGAVAGFMSVHLLDLGLPFLLVVLCGVVIGAAVSVVVSLPILRLESHYLALATLALVLITRVFVLNVTALTGGAAGMVVSRTVSTWELVLIVALAAWMFARLRRSRYGLAADTVRQDANVAAGLGVNVTQVRRTAMALSGGLAGAGGVMLANVLGYIGPDSYYIHLSFTMLAAVVLGGAFHWAGPIVGAVIFTMLPELLRQFLSHGEAIANGIILILIMIFLPRGLVDPVRFKHWRNRARRGKDDDLGQPVLNAGKGSPRDAVTLPFLIIGRKRGGGE